MQIIIIGAGIVGASAAYHLAKENYKVILIDANHQGQATAAGAGIICPWSSLERDETWYTMANEAAHFYPQFIKELKDNGAENVSYKKVGTLITATEAELLEDYLNILHKRKSKAPLMGHVEKLLPKDARELFPPLNDKLQALYIPGGSRVDGRALVKALVKISKNYGVKYIDGSAHLIVENDRAVGVTVDGTTYEADRILMTAGAWVNDLLKPFNLSLQIAPQRGQIVHLQLPETNTNNWPVISPAKSGHYIVSFDESKVVIGATRETGSGFDYRMTAGGIAEVLKEGLKVAPGLANSTLAEIRIGFRPFSDDLLPFIGPIEQIDNLFLANGLGPSGLTIGPFVGHLVSNLIQEKEISIDLSPYKPHLQSL